MGAGSNEATDRTGGAASPLIGAFLGLVVVLAAVAAFFGIRYLTGSWAPSEYQAGLQFTERPVMRSSDGEELSAVEVDEFLKLCGSLRTTTRNLGENKGTGRIRYTLAGSGEEGVLTIYSQQNVLFHGSWLDAKGYAMRGERAPCFNLTPEFLEFVERQNLIVTDTE